MAGVSNSTPLIYLDAVGDLELIPRLFGQISVPEAVYEEVVVSGKGRAGAEALARANGKWLTVRSAIDRNGIAALMKSSGLDIGEVEAIVLAQEHGLSTVFLDDRAAVLLARSLGLEVVTTPAVYAAAKRNGLIKTVRPKIDALRAQGFWLSDSDYVAVLTAAGERPAPPGD